MEKINEFLERLPSLDEAQILNDETMEQTEGGFCDDCIVAQSACQNGCVITMLTSSSTTTTAPPTTPTPTPAPLLPTTTTLPTTT